MLVRWHAVPPRPYFLLEAVRGTRWATLVRIRVVTGASRHQSGDKGTEQGFAAASGVVQRQYLVGREQPSPALIQELAGLLIPYVDVVEVDYPSGLRYRGQPPAAPSGSQ